MKSRIDDSRGDFQEVTPVIEQLKTLLDTTISKLCHVQKLTIEFLLVRHCKISRMKKVLTQAGLEPTISCSVGRRLIHWATEPSG